MAVSFVQILLFNTKIQMLHLKTLIQAFKLLVIYGNYIIKKMIDKHLMTVT